MTNPRPEPVGTYEILEDFNSPTASIRVFRMSTQAEAVGGHVHRRSIQIYVALAGLAAVQVDGVETRLHPYQALSVWPGSVHSATPIGDDAILMNISVPPLGADDQAPQSATRVPPDLRMPRGRADIDEWSPPQSASQ